MIVKTVNRQIDIHYAESVSGRYADKRQERINTTSMYTYRAYYSKVTTATDCFAWRIDQRRNTAHNKSVQHPENKTVTEVGGEGDIGGIGEVEEEK